MTARLDRIRFRLAAAALRFAAAVLPPGEPVEVLRRVHGLWRDAYGR